MVDFSDDYYSTVSVTIETLKKTYISDFRIHYFEKMDWDACFAENGRKELSVNATEDIISKSVKVKLTNRKDRISKVDIYGKYYRLCEIKPKSSIVVDIGFFPINVGRQWEIKCSSADEKYKQILKLTVKINIPGILPVKMSHLSTLALAKYSNNCFGVTAYGIIVGTKDPVKNLFFVKMIGLKRETVWSYRTNLNSTHYSLKVVLYKGTCLIADTANDGEGYTIHYVSISSGKLTRQIRVAETINSMDLEKEKYLVINATKYFDIEKGVFLKEEPVEKPVSDVRYECFDENGNVMDDHGYGYSRMDIKSYTLKKFEKNKLVWQYTYEGKIHCWVRMIKDNESIILSVCIRQVCEGGNPAHLIIRLDPKTGLETWRKEMDFSDFLIDKGKIYIVELLSGYLVVYDEKSGKLHGALRINNSDEVHRILNLGKRGDLLWFNEEEDWCGDLETYRIWAKYIRIEEPK